MWMWLWYLLTPPEWYCYPPDPYSGQQMCVRQLR